MKPIGDFVGGLAAKAQAGASGEFSRAVVSARPSAPPCAPEVARAILARPVPPLLAEALAAQDRIDPYTKPDGTVGYRTRRLPEDRAGVLALARERREALRAAMIRAPEKLVRAWCMMLASATETQHRGEGLSTLLDTLVTLLDLPACCFTPASVRMVAQDAARHDGWLPSYARINPIISELARPMREEAERLDKLIALLEAGPPGNRLAAPKLDSGEMFTDAEVDAWIASVAATPSSFPRTVRCRAFLKTLTQRRPDLSPHRIARIEALRDEQYGANRSAEPLPADNPERVTADEALLRRRQAQIDALLPRPQQPQGNAPA